MQLSFVTRAGPGRAAAASGSTAFKNISVNLVANSRLGIVNYNPRNIGKDIWSNAVTTGAAVGA